MESKDDKKQGFGFTIIYQILLTMCIVALIPIGGLWYNSVYKARENWQTTVSQSLASSTTSLTQSVDDWTTANLKILEQNSQTPAIRSMDSKLQDPVLQTVSTSYSWIYLAFTVLPSGENVGRSDGKATRYYGDRGYVKQVLDGKEVGQQLLLGKTSKKPAFILSKPIRDKKSQLLGVIALAMTLEDLSNTVTKTKIGKTGYAILLDENNRLIASGDGKISSSLQDFSSHPALHQKNKSSQDSLVYIDQGKQFVAHTQKTQQGWTLIVQQEYKEAFSAANKAQQNALILLCATLISVLVIAYLLANRISSPIRNLTNIANEISRGNLEANIKEKDRNDEIGDLGRAIERMGVSLQMAFTRLRKK
jgi:methyl-accepting chemotaxis protein